MRLHHARPHHPREQKVRAPTPLPLALITGRRVVEGAPIQLPAAPPEPYTAQDVVQLLEESTVSRPRMLLWPGELCPHLACYGKQPCKALRHVWEGLALCLYGGRMALILGPAAPIRGSFQHLEEGLGAPVMLAPFYNFPAVCGSLCKISQRLHKWQAGPLSMSHAAPFKSHNAASAQQQHIGTNSCLPAF